MHTSAKLAAPAPHILTHHDAKMMGAIARNYSLTKEDCPFSHSDAFRHSWNQGYDRVDRQIESALPLTLYQDLT